MARADPGTVIRKLLSVQLVAPLVGPVNRWCWWRIRNKERGAGKKTSRPFQRQSRRRRNFHKRSKIRIEPSSINETASRAYVQFRRQSGPHRNDS
jgi:hypothetical protein